jgi:ankyrin repeat protein
MIAAMFNHTMSLQNLLTQASPSSSAARQLALFWAACRGQTVSVKMILEYETEPDAPCDGQTPLHVAVQGGFMDICSALLATRKVNANFKKNRSRTPLSLAAEFGHCDILRLLLLQDGIQVNVADWRGRTAFLESAASGSLECLQELIRDRRVDSRCTDVDGRNALSHAAQEGKDQIVKLLLKSQDISLKAQDRFGRNALSYAAQRGHVSIVQQLVEAGFPISQQDGRGRNAISWAANSADGSSGDQAGRCALRYLVEKEPGAASTADESDWAPLAWAMDRPGYLFAVKILVEVGRVDVNQRDNTGGRPVLSWAASEGFVEIVEYLLTVPTLEKDLADNYGRTALFYAAAHGRLEIVRLLAQQNGVNARSVDSSGRTAADWARWNGQEAVVRELEAALQKL